MNPSTVQRFASNRWFILACLALLLNAFGIWKLIQHSQEGSTIHPLPVARLDFSPKDVLAGEKNVAWNFDRAMVPGEAVGVWEKNTLIRVEPEIAGETRWESPRRLAFRPSGKWRPGNRYQFAAKRELVDPNGTPLASTALGEIESEPFQLIALRQVSYDPIANTALLRAAFNDAPADAQIRSALEVSASSNPRRILALRDLSFAAGNEVQLRIEPDGETDITLTLLAGARGASGPIASRNPAAMKIKLSAEMSVGNIRGLVQDIAQPCISVQLSNPPDMTKAIGFIQVTPPIAFTLERSFDYGYGSGDSLRILGAFKPGTHYQVRILEGFPGTNGAVLQKTVTQSVHIPDYPAKLRFADAGRYLTSRGNLTLQLVGVNITNAVATLRQVYDNNLLIFSMRESSRYGYYGSRAPRDLMGPARRIQIPLTLERNQPAHFPLDISSVVTNGMRGAFWISLEADASGKQEENEYSDYGDSSPDSRMVVVSDLGLSVKNAPSGILAWVTSLHTGEAISGATVKVYSVSNQELGSVTTGPDGIARLALDPKADASATPHVVTASAENDFTFIGLDNTRVAISGNAGGDPWHRDGYEAFLYSDRGIYRPAETIHLRAIVRDASRLAPKPFPLEFRVLRPDGQEANRFTRMTSELGSANADILFPTSLPVGKYTVEAHVPGGTKPIGTLGILNEEFVPPQIVLKTETDSSRVSTGEVFQVRISARHLFGAPAAGQEIRHGLTLKAAPFHPEGWEDYVFGDSTRNYPADYRESEEHTLDDNGQFVAAHTVKTGTLPPAAIQVVIHSSIIESSGRASTTYTHKMVDPVPFYIALRSATPTWVAGQTGRLQIAAVSPSGQLAEVEKLSVHMERIFWNSVLEANPGGGYSYQYKTVREKIWTRDIPLQNGKGDFDCILETSGRYEVCVTSPSGAATRIPLYVSGMGKSWQDVDVVRAGKVELSLDAEEGIPGQKARLTVKAPFKGLALITIETDQVCSHSVLEMDGNAFEVPVQIPDTTDSTAYAVVSVIRPLKPGDLPGTHRATGLLPIAIRRPIEKATLAIEAPEIIRPQSKLSVTVRSPELAGQTAEVTIAAVDEGICLLTDFKTPDILEWLNRPRQLGVALFDAFNFLLPDLTGSLFGRDAKVGGDGNIQLQNRLNPVDARRFRPVALWSGPLALAPDGSVTTTFDVPEFTGQLRLMAVTCARQRYASATRHVIVRRPLVVQPSLPRFAAPGDRLEASMRLQNLSGNPARIPWKLMTEGPVAPNGESHGILDLAADAWALVRIPLLANSTAGVARISFVAGEGDMHYAETIELPIRHPRAAISESNSISIPSGETRTLEWPAGFSPIGLSDRLSVAGLPTLALSPALQYLSAYPFGCIEQTTSKAFPLLYLMDLAELASLESRSREDTATHIQKYITHILSMQTYEGWFTAWPWSREVYRYGSIYAMHFLTEARKLGYDVPDHSFQSGIKALQDFLRSWNSTSTIQDKATYQEIAYALYVLALNGQWEGGWSARLEEKNNDIPFAAQILNTLAKATAGHRKDAATLLRAVSPGTLGTTTPRLLRNTLNSPVQDLALLLSAWIEIAPTDPSIPDLVRRLQVTQKGNNGWYTTHDNALALMALGKYSARIASKEQPFSADITLRGQRVQATTDKPFILHDLKGPIGPVSITNRGPGTAYVSWVRTGIPTAPMEADYSNGLRIQRAWLDRSGKPINPSLLRQGDIAAVRVTLNSLDRTLDQVIIENLLPAGLEPENSALQTSETLSWIVEKNKGEVLHVEHRDDRVLAFTGTFRGDLVFHFLVRAATPGEYVLPAVSAECMYDPSIRAVKGAGKIKIEATR